MAKCDGDGLFGDGMSGCGAEVGSSEILVEICSANANKGRGDLFTLEMADSVPDLHANLDLSRPDCRLGNILNPNIFLSVVPSCAHCAVVE